MPFVSIRSGCRQLPKQMLLSLLSHGENARPSRGRNKFLRDRLKRSRGLTLLRAAREIDGEQGFEGDLYRIVVCLAATGARFAQARRMRVSDAQRKEQSLMVPGSYKGVVVTVAPSRFRWAKM